MQSGLLCLGVDGETGRKAHHCPGLSPGEASYLSRPCQGSPHLWPCLQVTLRLDTHPAMITVLEMGAARHFLRMRQLAKTQEERAQLLQPTLEINPR